MTKKTTLYILCGLPAAGKSTLCQLRQGRVITADIIRKGIVGSLGDSDHDEFVWETALNAAEYFLQLATFTTMQQTPQERGESRLWTRLRSLGKDVVCVWVATPLEVCIKQNQRRAKSNPDSPPDWVIEKVAGVFEPPTLDEGFAKIEKWLPAPSGMRAQFIYKT